MKAYISQLITEAVQQISPDEADAVLGSGVFDVSYPKPGFGDYASNAAMVLFKKFNATPAENPATFAQRLAAACSELDHSNTFSKIENVGGFINFTLSNAALLAELQQVLAQKEEYGRAAATSDERILLEYFQPNVAKPLHLGHLENGIFGDALFKLLAFTGTNVESDTHLGDWGTQFGLLLFAFKKWREMSVIEQDPIVELNKLYVRINAEIENEPELRELGKHEFVKLEQGDQENLQLWEQFKAWSWREFDFMYEDVGIRKADHDWPESYYADKMPQVVEALKAKGLLIESQGAQIVNLEEYGLGIAIIIKSDGSTTYLLRDLATYIYRKQQGFRQQLYVVDVRQSHTLAQTFKILELIGEIETKTEAQHIAYGFMTLPEGAMSTRKGTVVGAKELYEDAIQRAQQIIEEKNPGLANKNEVAKSVANAAIKYFILSRNLKNDIVFDRETALSFEGNTGPYLQYTHARISGIWRKFSDVRSGYDSLQSSESNEIDTKVMRRIQQFPEIVATAARDYAPNHLTNYLYELAKDFNSFYETNSVMHAETKALQELRVAIAKATAQILKNGLNLLGIDAPEEM